MFPQISHASTVLRLFFLNFIIRHTRAQFIPICPIGFVWGGYCSIGAFSQCPASLPPFHCISGSCCRDQRPLIARLGPILYPWNLGIGGGLGGIGGGLGPRPGGIQNTFPGLSGLGGVGGGSFCFDSALNCFSFISYCFQSQYQLCMATHCRRSCGFCRLGGIAG